MRKRHTGQPKGSHRLARATGRAAGWITWRRRPEAFERHLTRSAPILDALRAQGHANPNVLAILAAESFYRPRAIRAVEYCFWAFASALRRPVDRLSVGDLEANYVACSRFLARGGMLAEPRGKIVAMFYTGTSLRYADLIQTARTAMAGAPV